MPSGGGGALGSLIHPRRDAAALQNFGGVFTVGGEGVAVVLTDATAT